MHDRASELIEVLGMQPHPEGGYFREIFRSAERVVPEDRRGVRSALTTIYFLLTEGTFSRWHQVASDEVWHLYEGGPLQLFELPESADNLRRHVLSPVDGEGGAPVWTIPARHWQAARPVGSYALVGCTVGPGFEFADFRFLADVQDLAARVRKVWPDVAELV